LSAEAFQVHTQDKAWTFSLKKIEWRKKMEQLKNQLDMTRRTHPRDSFYSAKIHDPMVEVFSIPRNNKDSN
jgi:hypothetical protein